MNPLGMMELAAKYSKFKEQHPKFGMFLKSVANKNLKEGSVMYMEFKDVDGETYSANIKLTKDDLEFLEMLK